MQIIDRRQHVVIVGGGFAGTELARRLAPARDRLRVTLVSEHNYTTFSPLLPEVVSTSVLPGQAVAPLREMLGRDQRFLLGRVEGVDLECRRLALAPDAAGAPEETAYDHLVLAVGARANLAPVPGLADHAIPLKLVGDAMAVRNAVIARLERADHAADPEERRRLVHFVVVGGGFSGVEVAGEIHDFIRRARRFYGNVPDGESRVSVVHAEERLLPELPEKLAVRARDSMVSRGIGVHLATKARRADASGLEVEDVDGAVRRIPAGLLVSTIGTRANPLVERLALETDRGRIRTRADLSVPQVPGLWAIGDCAAAPNAAREGPTPTTAQFAVREARQAARNIRAASEGRPTEPFSFAGLGTIATMGNKRGIASVLGVPVAGFPAWLLWRAFYLLQMPTTSRKFRLWVAWTWDMLFRRDISQLAFATSATLARRDEAAAGHDTGAKAPEGRGARASARAAEAS